MNSIDRSNSIEVADVFRQYGPDYQKLHKQPLHKLKVMSSICNCRTSTMGGHIDECDNCGHQKISYNS